MEPTASKVKITATDGYKPVATKQSPNGGAFVHMGKTGGSTLSVLLRNGCHSYMHHPCRNVTHESIASKLIESYYHVPDFGLLRQSHHDFYLLTARDPFDRVVSSFCYMHIRNQLARNDTIIPPLQMKKFKEAFKCFPSLEVFVSYLQETTFDYPYSKNVVIADSCQDFARAVFYGHVRIFSHIYFSFQRIRSFIPAAENQVYYVTRQEHLWDDWKRINQLLGEDVDIPQEGNTNKRNTTHLERQKVLPVTRELSESGRAVLCRALGPEYEAYIWFLRRAKNLDKSDVLEAITMATKRCPELKL